MILMVIIRRLRRRKNKFQNFELFLATGFVFFMIATILKLALQVFVSGIGYLKFYWQIVIGEKA